MPTIKQAVLILPDLIAATTFPLLAASILIELTILSLTIITTGIIGWIKPWEAKIIKTELTKTLSAIASSSLPKSVIKLYLRAMNPSKKSVIEAKEKIKIEV